MIIRIDRDLCIGAAPCVAIAPEVFELDEEGKAIVIDPKGADEETLILAAEACPVQCIFYFEEPANDNEEHGKQIFPKVA